MDWVGGWVQKKVIFAGIQYCIYADMVSGWVWKSAKMWLRNYVIYYQLKFEPLQSKNQGAQKWHLQNNTDNSHLVSNGRIYQVAIEENNHFMDKKLIHLPFWWHDVVKVEKILKGSLDSIPSPSSSVKIQIMGRKVCLRCKGKTSLDIATKIWKKKFADITQQCFALLAQVNFPANS